MIVIVVALMLLFSQTAGACDKDEAIAASKAWAKDMLMRDPDDPFTGIVITPAIHDPCAFSETSGCLRLRAEAVERAEQVARERYRTWKRWRKALDACP